MKVKKPVKPTNAKLPGRAKAQDRAKLPADAKPGADAKLKECRALEVGHRSCDCGREGCGNKG